MDFSSVLNLFTAPACKISRLKNARTHPKTVYFPVLGISTSNAMRFDENFLMQVRQRRQKGLMVSNVALLLVVVKWHHGSEGVNSFATSAGVQEAHDIFTITFSHRSTSTHRDMERHNCLKSCLRYIPWHFTQSSSFSLSQAQINKGLIWTPQFLHRGSNLTQTVYRGRNTIILHEKCGPKIDNVGTVTSEAWYCKSNCKKH